ncbi:MAG TPA: F0F1 ATP synthase subunit delta [Candidatus Competibacteraceae bacterium]|nr:F0F1 ATP synthase subunit delta [Candidatus Competibacteraceae bacterium]MCP5132984.1 F0F1 ATP synthase subunit delta [Gammaproteobacteria bacterium]HRY17242.1 F0F1 ATP synthase subunit delta [Candidatus Competibacteraceae bacterium]
MAETTTVVRPTAAARPYARAAFEEAQETGNLPLWSELLSTAAAVAADPALQRLLGPWNPQMRGDQKAELVAGVCRDVRGDEEAPEAFVTFLKMLAEFHRLHMLPSIAVLFERLRAEAESILHAELISSATVTDTQRNRVITALKTKFQRDVALDCKIDESLIAGAVIRVGDLVIDGSARGRLDKLVTALSQ